MNPSCRGAADPAPLVEGSLLEDGCRQALELDKRAAAAGALRDAMAMAWQAAVAEAWLATEAEAWLVTEDKASLVIVAL